MSHSKPNKPLRVMLVDDKSDRREMIDFALQDIECALVACVSGDGDLLSAVQQCNPDVILIDIEAPGRDTLESLESVQSTVPRPMVMFSQDDNNRTIRRATQAGVSAYVVDGLQGNRVRPIIDAAVARFQHFNHLESELKKAHQQLNDRKVIDKAKGIIMKQRGVNEEQAYQAMRKLAMDTNRKIAEVAQNIIEAASILSG
ncbi:MAG: response regulator [gamma proteobacterium symbiont of Stewartia floridana]|uniref:ANTAR domain-containing protein n=1 Tax=Candidatus Thiodiazotropha taylori TaxID=2792791 RepID=A0A9E4U147_9GAMM|nr:ANTAR domain-containing protein [Candidatus Thiodiazotropha taylori]MCG7961536.1 ANTAR domain-containing protein [Candidatus Thiodiazotropha endolucinida]RLW55801.1 MAG: response regulator [gamma proteobacterium symbiont of Stewartia floridana]MCG7870057.1 ANTAR domain-containing protein [Candidatus Thiodiazotropha taylori]MCG7896268.1 ANTAR domain-containing protein [Candidatus Thiodiazotropha taylori]